MGDEEGESESPDKAARWAIAMIALVLIGVEIWQTLYHYRIVETYARSDQTRIFEVVDRMAVAHGIRVALIATLLVSWRWSLWVTVLSVLIVYVPNPWVSGEFMNSAVFVFFLVPLIMIAHFFDKRLLFPWRSTVP